MVFKAATCAFILSLAFVIFTLKQSSYSDDLNFSYEEVNKENCAGVPMDTEAYILQLAKEGNARAQFLLGDKLSQGMGLAEIDPFIHMMKNAQGRGVGMPPKEAERQRKEAVKWWEKAAAGGDVYAQASLAVVYRERFKNLERSFYWAERAALQGHKKSAFMLGLKYKRGLGVEVDYKKAYFWLILGGAKAHTVDIREGIAEAELEKLDKIISEWRPQLENEAGDKGASIPINIQGLRCGGKHESCVIQDACAKYIAISCGGSIYSYFIVDKENNEIISSCEIGTSDCLSLVPDDWVCSFPSPRNMPLSKHSQKLFPKYRQGAVCGELVSSGGGEPWGYSFTSLRTNKPIAYCSPAALGKCLSQIGWSCKRPSNYP